MNTTYRLIIACPDQVGIVATVSGFISQHKGMITEAIQHACSKSNWFFMRYEIDTSSLNLSLSAFRQQFDDIAKQFTMNWKITDSGDIKKVAILVSKEDHCLQDLLYRRQSEGLPCDIACIVSNHTLCQQYADWHKIPYHHIPVNQTNKTQAFQTTFELLEQYQVDTIVLARYMQVIPNTFCERYFGRIINIHHGFLPSFTGAKPYHQAFDKGVKLVGATCHYATAELDQGPIIDQDVIRISHRDSEAQIVRRGKDIEKNVLARSLRYHLEDRILIHNNKTVVFS